MTPVVVEIQSDDVVVFAPSATAIFAFKFNLFLGSQLDGFPLQTSRYIKVNSKLTPQSDFERSAMGNCGPRLAG